MVGGENPGPLLDDWVAVIWIHAMAATPWVVLIVGLGSTTVDPELEEMALLPAEQPNPITLPCSVWRVVALGAF